MLRSFVLSAAGVAVLAASGLAHGLWVGRWQPSSAIEQAVAALDRLPREVGDWTGKDVEADPKTFEKAGAARAVVRAYEHKATGRVVSLMLVCGGPGRIAVHTPDICYAGAGYKMAGPAVRQTVAAEAAEGGAEFWTGRFAKPGAAGGDLRIFWGWRAPGGAWAAPDNPRWTFAGAGALFKMYLVRETAAPDEKLEEDPALALFRELLPHLGD